jgi:hypothetical protein
MSFKPEVQTDNTGQWYGNALRFTTHAEAEAQVADLMLRWTAVRDTRVVECNDPVNLPLRRRPAPSCRGEGDRLGHQAVKFYS